MTEIAGDIGAFSHVSVAVDAFWGMQFIVWYDAVNGDLRWARTVDFGATAVLETAGPFSVTASGTITRTRPSTT
jgi:hypothetical protein